MKKRLLVMLLAISLLAGNAMANLLVGFDPGFEDAGTVSSSTPLAGPQWTTWLGAQNLVPDPDAVSGNVLELVGAGGAMWGWISDPLYVTGSVFEITMDVRATSGAAADNIQFNMNGSPDWEALTVPGDDAWHSVTFTWTAIDENFWGGANTVLFSLGGNDVLVDNMSLVEFGMGYSEYHAFDPTPNQGDNVVDPATSTLSWTLPAPRVGGDILSVDVYFDTVEQNVIDGLAGSKIVDKAAGATNATVSLTANTNYFWRADVYDPNSGDEIKTDGLIWSFGTQSMLATAPVPADDATSVSIYTTDLDWYQGYGSTADTLYGPSTDEAAVINGTAPSTGATAPYDLAGNLDLDTEYFWRIDGDNGSGDGTVWSYTTAGGDYIEEVGVDFDPNDFVTSPGFQLASLDTGWIVFPLDDAAAQTYTRTLDEAVDASSAVILQFSHWQDADVAQVPDVTVKLLDSTDTVIVEEIITDLEASTVVTRRVEMLITGPGSLSDVKKIVVEVPASSSAVGTILKMHGFYISVPACDTPPAFDPDGDCLVTVADFAAFAATWLDCGLFPVGSCP